jgi:branched-chain amino acid transport system ATP-binding protein
MVLICLLGGIGTVHGPVIGAALLVPLEEVLRNPRGLVTIGLLPSDSALVAFVGRWVSPAYLHRGDHGAAHPLRARGRRRPVPALPRAPPAGRGDAGPLARSLTAMALLEIRHLSKYFGGLAANADVSFSVEKGSIVGLIGPNGAGKTTLFDCVTGFHRPDRGEVRYDGIRLNGKSPDRICKLGLARTWQKVRPLSRLSVLENVMIGAFARTRDPEVARVVAEDQLRVVGLLPRAAHGAGGLPIGERKKLEVARVLATRPQLVLLDEVMGGLNPTESDEVIGLVLKLRKNGLTFVVIEHDMRAIMRISDRVVVLDAGEKLAEGTPAQVVGNREVVAAYLGEAP